MRGCINGAVVLIVTMAASVSVIAAPPSLEIPVVIKPTGDYATLIPKTDAVSVIYVGLSGVDAFPSEFLKDPRSFILPVRGLKDGTYKFAAVGASKTGEQARTDFAVVIGAGGDPVIPKDPTDPVDPIAPFHYYFMLVRPDGPVNPTFTALAGNPAWKTIISKGHEVGSYPLSTAKNLGAIPRNPVTPIQLPCIVILKVVDGKAHVQKIMSPIPSDPLKLLEEPK